MRASQASPSDPVEVSWSPPSAGATITAITGYYIIYGNGMNASVSSDITLAGLTTNANFIGQTVTVCTEFEQLSVQCTPTVVTGKYDNVYYDHFQIDAIMISSIYYSPVSDADLERQSICSCSSEVGITVGVVLILLCLVLVVVAVTVVMCYWLKRRCRV